MAGEIEEPIRLDFKADSFHSGSISFGRFENEALCWERRSSFSHNKYLEEVEKFSKPGLVIEKKAYFEAHFRKKGILGLSLPEISRNETEYQTSENDISETRGCDEEINQLMNVVTPSPCDDENLDGSVHGRENEVMELEREVSGTSTSNAQIEHLCGSSDNVDFIHEYGEVEEAHHGECGSVFSTCSGSEVEVKENIDGKAVNVDTGHVSNVTIDQFSDSHETERSSNDNPKEKRGSSSKGKSSSQAEYMKPRLALRVNAAQRERRIPSQASKGSDKKSSKIVNNLPMRSKAEKQTSKAAAQDKCSTHQTPKHEPVSKAKRVDEIKRGGKESRNGKIEEPQSSSLRKVPSRVHQSENRIKNAVGMTQQCIKRDGSRLSFKRNEHAERRKELSHQFEMKIEEKMHAKEAEVHRLQKKMEAQMKLLGKSLNFKAKPLPSFYRGALRESDRNKVTHLAFANSQTKDSNVKPLKLRTKSSSTGRVSGSSPLSSGISATPKTTDPPPASGATSCHSTVTSDSSPSSPASEINKGHSSQMVINSQVCGKKEKEKGESTSLRKHKVPEFSKICKYKTMEIKQKKITERSIHAAFGSSSKTGRK